MLTDARSYGVCPSWFFIDTSAPWRICGEKEKGHTGSLHTSSEDENPLDPVNELYNHPPEGKIASTLATYLYVHICTDVSRAKIASKS